MQYFCFTLPLCNNILLFLDSINLFRKTTKSKTTEIITDNLRACEQAQWHTVKLVSRRAKSTVLAVWWRLYLHFSESIHWVSNLDQKLHSDVTGSSKNSVQVVNVEMQQLVGLVTRLVTFSILVQISIAYIIKRNLKEPHSFLS